MSERSIHPLSDASNRDDTRPGILTPVSDAENHTTSQVSGSRKRKRDGHTLEDLLRESFMVKPYPKTVSVKPRTLHPLMVIPRAQLPLSCLEFAPSTRALPHSRLFETNVKILEWEERMGSQPTVLIAKLDDLRTLFAVERESRGLYVICQLGSWVSLHDLRPYAIALVSEETCHKNQPGVPKNEDDGSLPVLPEARRFAKKKRLAIEAIQSMVKRPTSNCATDSQPAGSEKETPVTTSSPAPLEELNAAQVTSAVDTPVVEEILPTPVASEIFDNVRTHYLEALYLSQASLAYFVKGPLSRARAAFHLDIDSTLDLNDYITFLESLVLTSSVLDKKYRNGLPTCVSLIDVEAPSGEDVDSSIGKKKKRRAKKMKLGKNGLYPTEDSLIRKWWASHGEDSDVGAPGYSRDKITKARTAQLRMRETQLQMIVILEFLALKPLATTTAELGEDLPAILPSVEVPKTKDAKSKKADKLTMLLDIHIDRLCIWQSLALETVAAPALESQSSVMLQTDGSSRVGHTDNILRDFCVEIIAPFFSARLPERCASINRKFGGPVAVSPPKPRLPKSASFSGPSRPGAATKRPVPAVPRKNLQRMLTEDRERRSMSRGPNKAIALLRSATVPTGPIFKREGSEAPSLSGIPKAHTHAHGRASSISHSHLLNSKLSSREIDLGDTAQDKNAKARKQAMIDAQLKEAISALKKPNRELAGKTIVETAEMRSNSASRSRKSKKPVRNPLFQDVQITATPKAVRRFTTNMDHHNSDPFHSTGRLDPSIIPASSAPRIPQSTTRPSERGMTTRNPLFESIQATPTRKSTPGLAQHANTMAGFSDIGFQGDGCPPSSPLQARKSAKRLFAVPDSAVKQRTSSLPMGILETPIKRRQESTLDHGHPGFESNDKENTREVNGKSSGVTEVAAEIGKGGDDIYKSLGWDDDDDDL